MPGMTSTAKSTCPLARTASRIASVPSYSVASPHTRNAPVSSGPRSAHEPFDRRRPVRLATERSRRRTASSPRSRTASSAISTMRCGMRRVDHPLAQSSCGLLAVRLATGPLSTRKTTSVSFSARTAPSVRCSGSPGPMPMTNTRRPWSRPMPYVLPYVRAEDLRVPAGPAESPAQRPREPHSAVGGGSRAGRHRAGRGRRWRRRSCDPSIRRSPGRLVGVGVGPGAADLLTVRALRALHRATAVVAPCTDIGAMGRAEAIVREAAPDVAVERLVFAMAPEPAARVGGDRRRGDADRDVARQGEEVAFITLGDPNLYSTFSSITAQLADRPAGDARCHRAGRDGVPRARRRVGHGARRRPAVVPRAARQRRSGKRARWRDRDARCGTRSARSSSTREDATSKQWRAGCARPAAWRARSSASCSGCPASVSRRSPRSPIDRRAICPSLIVPARSRR